MIKAIHLELKLKIDIVLQQLINRFVFVCPHASKSEHLRQPPAFVILPAGNSTAIAGIVFKADDKGATYICFPNRYLNFWKLWFEIQNEKISDTLNLINRVDMVPRSFPS